ncbi:MAG: CehA/McbA family metallohydrolase [Gemmatimonadota bacterium]
MALLLAFVLCASALSAGPLAGQWTNRYPKVSGLSHHVYLEGFELPTLTNGPIDPAVSPDGSAIAFSSRGWIWVLETETGDAVRLTNGRDMDFRPAWSPDGASIAFVRDNDHDMAIVIVDAGSGEQRLVIDSPALDLDPSFSPDGSALLYSSGRAGSLDLWEYDLNTGTDRQLTDSPGIELRPQPGPGVMVYLAKGRGGPDRIVLRREGEEGAAPRDLSLQHGSITSMTRPALSPDGKIVAFNWPTQDGWDLRLMHVDDPGPTILLVGGGLPLTPSWSHDGEWVYYAEADSDERMGLWRVRRAGGPAEAVRVVSWDWGEETARVRVRTSVDGRASATRLSVVDGSGHPAVPDASAPRFEGQSGRVFFYSPGVVELTVPAGPILVSAVRGLATPEVVRTVEATPGSVTEVSLELTSIWDAGAAGWVSGEHHFHLNYGGPYDLDPADLVPLMRGEDLDIATPLLANLHNRFEDQDLWGWEKAGEAPLIRFGQEVRSHFLGHLGLIETQELFWPWVWGPGYEVYGADDRENAEALSFARAQGGMAYYVHPVSRQNPFADDGLISIPIELIADAVLGDLDAIELVCLWSDELGTADVWYRFLNLGIPVAPTAGSDVMLDYYRTMAVGTTRVYANTGGALNWPAYVAALKEGRSFVTNGPLLELDVGGVGPGGVIAPGGVVAPNGVAFEVTVRSATAVERIEVLVNGEIVASGPGLTEAGETTFSGDITLPAGGWVAARAVGGETAWPSMDSYPFAHTSPVWIGERASADPAAVREAAADLLRALEVSRAVLLAGYGGNDIPNLIARFDAARDRLEALAATP